MFHFVPRVISTLTGLQSLVLLAEIAVDPPSNPWTVGGVIGGSTVMGILTWIFGFYIPRKDKFIETLITNHNKELKERDRLKNEETLALRTELAAGRAQFLEALRITSKHCEDEIAKVHEIYEKASRLSRDSMEWDEGRKPGS